jgi:hypothetical protein
VCGSCGQTSAAADAEFCADCGLFVGPECFAAYCERCCQPRCPSCAASSARVCAVCAAELALEPAAAYATPDRDVAGEWALALA